MGLEIERKFLVSGSPWQSLPQGPLMRQGYILSTWDRVVRIRIEGDQAMLTIKSAKQAMIRGEWEYPVPLTDADELLKLCEQPLIEKYRFRIPFENMLWEVDVFVGDNAGLVVAEIELESPEQTFVKPEWLGAEVTNDPRYLNANLSHHPFLAWQ